MHAVADDRHRRAADQPDMAVEAGAFVPPAFLGIGIDPHDDHVRLVAETRERRQIDIDAVIARPIVRGDAAIDPDRRVCGDAVEMELDRLAAIGRVEPQRAPVPADAARAIALRDVGGADEGLPRRPVVRQPHFRPVRIVIGDRRRAKRIAGLDAQIGVVVPLRLGRRNIAFMETPAKFEARTRGIEIRELG